MKKTLAATVAAALGALMLSGCSTVADKETTLKWAGHYNGTGLTMSGEGQPVEITLDQYQCFVYFPKKQGELLTGFYSLKGDVMELKTSGSRRLGQSRREPARRLLRLRAKLIDPSISNTNPGTHCGRGFCVG